MLVSGSTRMMLDRRTLFLSKNYHCELRSGMRVVSPDCDGSSRCYHLPYHEANGDMSSPAKATADGGYPQW